MRKRDCLYLHALCVLVRRDVEERRDLPDGAFESYEDVDVQPTEIYRQKTDHQRALFALLDDLCRALDGADDVAVSRRVDPEEPS